METSTHNLILAPEAAVDLQLHTVHSDGHWTIDGLLDYLVGESFGLVAITDHDRVDTAPMIQQAAREKGMPVLVAAEMTTRWRGAFTDVLSFGFEPEDAAVRAMMDSVLRRQIETTRLMYDTLVRMGFRFAEDRSDLETILQMPSAAQPPAMFDLAQQVSGEQDEDVLFQQLKSAGYRFETTDMGEVVDTVHRAGGVVLIAHPGRRDGYTPFDEDRLDQLRSEIPIDGFEVYYPKHSQAQTEMFSAYAEKHRLLTSSGSDSHDNRRQLPIRYRAELSRPLLERLGVQVKG